MVLQQCQHALDLLLHSVALLQEQCSSLQEVLEESLHNRSIQCKQKGWNSLMLILLTLCDQLYDHDCAHPAPAFALTSRSRNLFTALDAVWVLPRTFEERQQERLLKFVRGCVLVVIGNLKTCHRFEHCIPDITYALVFCTKGNANNCTWLGENFVFCTNHIVGYDCYDRSSVGRHCSCIERTNLNGPTSANPFAT